MIAYYPAGATPTEIWDHLTSLATESMSIGKLLTENVLLFDHFEAITIADLVLEYTGAATGGGTATIYVDDEPSVLRLQSGAVQNDGYVQSTDRTVSIESLEADTIVLEFRSRVNSEVNLQFTGALYNDDVDVDQISCFLDTAGGGAAANGCLRTGDDGVNVDVAAGLIAALTLTDFNVFRLEYTPGESAYLYANDVELASQLTPASLPDSNSFFVRFQVRARGGVANRIFDIDYFKVWGE